MLGKHEVFGGTAGLPGHFLLSLYSAEWWELVWDLVRESSEGSALVVWESGFLLLCSREPLRFFWLFWTGHDQSP